MLRYIIRRLLGVIVLLIIVSALTFGVFFMLSPNPALLACGKQCTTQRIAAINHKLGLDRPIGDQYGDYMKGIFVGRYYPAKGPGALHCTAPCLGYSFKNDQPVWATIKDRAPATFSIGVGAGILWLLLGVGVGVISALRKGSLLDRGSMTIALTAVSMPSFFTGLLGLYFFSFKLSIFPNSGYTPLVNQGGHWYQFFTDFGTTLSNFPQWAYHLALPWLVLAFLYAALYARLTRANMLETMNEDYIRTARAKGLKESKVITRHGLRAALTPIVTIFGLDLGALLGGAIITEQIFGIQGIGKLTIDSINNVDLPMLVGVVLFAAFFIIMANLIVDILYAFVDPKVQYS